MRVLHVIPAIGEVYGGPSTVLLPLCENLAKIGIDVSIACTDSNGQAKPITRESVKTDVPLHIFPKTYSEAWKFSSPFIGWIKKNVSRFDIVHTHAVWSFLPYFAARTARQFRVPYVVRPAGMLSSYSFSQKPLRKKILWWACESKVMANAAAFHATSFDEAQEILKICPKGNVWQIPHGLSEDAFTTPFDGGWIQNRANIDKMKPTILYFSRLHPKKGICDLLLPAFNEMKSEANLVIAGGADPHALGYVDEIKNKIDSLGLSGRVQLLGQVSARERWHAFDSADLFVLPSQSENFGVVVIEAMARGTPVIISDQVQIGDIVARQHGGWVIPRNIALWAQTMDDALSSKQARKPRYETRWIDVAQELKTRYESVAKK